MSNPPPAARCDAFVFFGASGDLAYKKIFPALYAMERRARLDVPVIGVARSEWTREQFQQRARQSVGKHVNKVDDAVMAAAREARGVILQKLRGLAQAQFQFDLVLGFSPMAGALRQDVASLLR